MSLGLMQSGRTVGSSKAGAKKKKPKYDSMLAAMLGEDDDAGTGATSKPASTTAADSTISASAVVSNAVDTKSQPAGAATATAAAEPDSTAVDADFQSSFARLLNVLNDERGTTRDVRTRTIESLAISAVPNSMDVLNISSSAGYVVPKQLISTDALSRGKANFRF
jgi:hypothetical protein